MTASPQPHATTFSRSSTLSVGSGSSGDITLLGDEPRKKPFRFRSATVAIDAGLASFNAYRRGKGRRGKGPCSSRGVTLHC